MKRFRSATLFASCCLLAAPLAAQTQIGGGTCSSATVNGAYAVTLTGRQVNSSGNFQNVFQANGSATFDGLSKVTLTLTAGTAGAQSSMGTQMTWSGTYSMQANCAGVITISSGGSATLNLILYDQGADFLLTGTDSTYSYSGSGNSQPSTCSMGALSGVYTLNASGYALSGAAVTGDGDGLGLIQFNGQGNLTVNFTMVSNGKSASQITLTGQYMVSSNCLGSATLTDSNGNSYVMSLSIDAASTTAINDLYATLAESGKFLLSGGAHAAYGQPAATTASDVPGSPEGSN